MNVKLSKYCNPFSHIDHFIPSSNVQKLCIGIYRPSAPYDKKIAYEPLHKKTNNLHMRKQRRRSASR